VGVSAHTWTNSIPANWQKSRHAAE
jgi:hypothetical protein